MRASDRREATNGWEIWLAGAVLFLLSGALVPLLSQGSTDFDINTVPRDNVLLRLTFLALYGAMGLLILTRLGKFMDVVVGNPWVPVTLLLVGVSVVWSADPGTTVQRGVATILTGLFGCYLAASFSEQAVLRLVAVVLGIGMLMSIMAVGAAPAYGTSDLGWRGVYLFKNDLGRVACLSVIVFVVLATGAERVLPAKRWLWGLAWISCVLLIGSQARSALVVLIVVLSGLSLLPVPGRLHGLRSGVVAIGAGAVTVAYALGARPALLFAVLGKDSDLTGRTPLWGYVWQSIERHPWIGHGYSAFWGGLHAPSSVIWEHVAWRPTHAHNGLLEIWLDLGLIGVICVLSMLIWTCVVAFHRLRLGQGDDGPRFALAFVAFLVVSSFTESVFLKSNVIYTCLLFYVASRTSRQPRAKTRVPLARDALTKRCKASQKGSI